MSTASWAAYGRPSLVDLAIFGAGIMGTSHVRVARGIPHARVALVVAPDLPRAEALARRVGAEAAATVPSRPSFDAAVVAAPTELHREIAVPLLEAGIPLLVEKPIARTIEDAEAIVE